LLPKRLLETYTHYGDDGVPLVVIENHAVELVPSLGEFQLPALRQERSLKSPLAHIKRLQWRTDRGRHLAHRLLNLEKIAAAGLGGKTGGGIGSRII
jgi:hypothetical protein